MPKPPPRRVISGRNLPSRIPLWSTLTVWLLLDRYQPPGWVWGAVGLFFLLIWAAWLHDSFTKVDVDLLSNHKE
jgi:hypothetical protein